MSQAFRKLTANASKCDCTIIFLNQLRHKVGVVYGNPEVTSGGQALKFYASVRLEVRRKQTVEDSSGTGIGIKVKAKVGLLLKCSSRCGNAVAVSVFTLWHLTLCMTINIMQCFAVLVLGTCYCKKVMPSHQAHTVYWSLRTLNAYLLSLY